MFKRLFGKKENKKPNTPLPKVAPAAAGTGLGAEAQEDPKSYASNFPAPPTTLPMPMPPTTDPHLVAAIKSLQLYNNVFPEETFQQFLTMFELRIKNGWSTLFSIQFAIKKALENSIVEKEVIFQLMRPGNRKLEDVISIYLNPKGVDKDVYATVYRVLMNQHLREKAKKVYGSSGGKRKTHKRKARKSKKSRKANRRR
jgi:hypothetical protein